MVKLVVRKFGLFGAVSAILFYVIFLALGFFQSDYSLVRDTVSKLVSGEYCWIQTFNFLILILSTFLISFGLKKTLIKNNVISKVFYLIFVELFFVLVFPIGETFFGVVHYIITFLLIITISVLILLIVKDMKKNSFWKNLVPYFIFTLLFNLIFGSIWYIFDYFQILVDWQGLFQKIIILNMISWLSVTGFKLWRFK
jgi:hypothetical protein